MGYDHTQRNRFYWLSYLVAVACLAVAPIMCRLEGIDVGIILAVAGAVNLLLAPTSHYLRVFDTGDQLRIQFGPLPLFGTRLRYDEMTAVEPGRLGSLYFLLIGSFPGRRGFTRTWTYAIHGQHECVIVRLGKKTVRIGTDDADNLFAFLQTKLPPRELMVG